MGDSTALSLDSAFRKLATARHWTYLNAAHDACGIAGLWHVGVSPEWNETLRECPALTRRTLEELAARWHPTLIVATSRWEIGSFFRPNGSTVTPGTGEWATGVREGLATFARDVTAMVGAKLALLQPLPDTVVNPWCIRHPNAGRCAPAITGTQQSLQDFYTEVAREVDGTVVISLNAVLCPADRCPPVVNDVLFRSDGLHFSVPAGRRLAEPLGAALQRAHVVP